MVLSAVGGFPEVAASRAPPASVPPEDPDGARRGARRAGRRRGRPRTSSPRPRRGRGRPLLLGRGRRPDPRPLRRAAGGAADDRRSKSLFWLCAGLIVYTHVGYPLVLAACSSRLRAGIDRAASPAVAERAAACLPDRRRLRRGGGDRGEGRQRARARLPARAARADRRLRRLRPTRPSSGPARPAPTSSSSCRGAARSPPRTPPPSAPPARSSPSPTPTASGRRTRCAAWSSPSPTRRSATSAARSASPTPSGGNLEGAYWRYEMAVREMESALAGITAGNGAIYAVRRDAYLPLAPSGSHDLSFPFALAKRGLRSLYAPAGEGRGEDGADAGGRVRPQTADDGRPLGHRRRRGDVCAARLPAPLRLRARSPTACCAT